jgi:hypothetical protein
MPVDPRDPDASLLALFRNSAVLNAAKTAKEGRPIYDDMEVVEIRFPGRRDWQPFPAAAFSHWAVDPHTGGQTPVSYAERFSRQYRQFKEHAAQTKAGTPLDHVPFLTEARRAELRALNVYTVEALAAVDGQELKNLGTGGRDMKNAAMEFIATARANAPNTQMAAEIEALRARNQTLEDDLVAAKKAQNGTSDFEDMTDDQLRDFIKVHTGHAPQGNLNRKMLMRMAADARPSKAA